MAFRPRANRAAVPSDPEQLYRTLAGQDGAPRALWVHQGDVLREWHANFRDSRDVAIELPTGAGKTLVGGLIGEWRRRSGQDRVAYLCLTRQLAQQTVDNLLSYGIPAVLLTGEVAKWNRADRAKYTSAEAIAVTTYFHVFNSNPAVDDAQVLLFDDAHSGDGFASGPWSLEIDRDDAAYHDVLALLRDAIDPLILDRLRTNDDGGQFRSSVYLASPLGVAAVAADLEAALHAAVAQGGISKSAKYVWRLLEGHVDRCLVYVAYRGIQIRPLIPPTGVHAAFEGARQRIYMSATLGSGGELERAYGRTRIDRIPIPKGWDRQGTGRRLFCFPELTTDVSHDAGSVDAWVSDSVARLGKALALTPDSRTARVFKERRVPPRLPEFTAAQVEDDLDVFAGAGRGVLLLTNRYDGIDLPDATCRLVVMQGLPAHGDLQERFLFSALGALEVLQERIRARVVQGAGRATRNAGDFAVVVLLGSDLTNFVTRKDVQRALHPEVQAELDFGLRNSLQVSAAEMTENIDIFLQHGDAWREVEAEIAAERDELDRQDPPGTVELQRSAASEVSAWLAAWQGDWERALEFAREVVDALRGGTAPQRYAALWNYLAACWAARLADQTGDDSLRSASTSYLRAARAAGRGTTWLSHLAAPADHTFEAEGVEPDPLDIVAARNIIEAFTRLARASVFDEKTTAMRLALDETLPEPYEEALVLLGQLAGARPSDGNSGASAAPDATWIFGATLWVCWEAKSDAVPSGELGANDVRQAGGHLRFVQTQRSEPIPPGSVSLVMTPQERVHSSATAVAEPHVFLARPTEVVAIAGILTRAWRTLRARTASPTESDVMTTFAAEHALPSQWLPALLHSPLMPSANDA